MIEHRDDALHSRPGSTVWSALRSGHRPTLVGAWLHLTVGFMVWLLFAALAPAIGEELGLSATQLGIVVALPLLSGAVLRVVTGWACDWVGTKRTGLVVLAVQVLAVLWAMVGGTHYPELLAIGLLLGAGGASFAVAMPVAGRAYPAVHRGLVLGLVASGNLGTVVVLWLAPWGAALVGWHRACGLMAIPLLATAVLFTWVVREAPPARPIAEGAWWKAARQMLRRPSVYWLCFVYGMTFGGFVGLISLLPLLLYDQYGRTPIMAGLLAACCGLVGSVIRPIGGYLADRWGGLRLLVPLFLGLAVTSLATPARPGLDWAVGLFVLTVGLMGLGNGVIFQLVAEWFPRDIGLASGLVGAAGSVGGCVIPLGFGLLRDQTGTLAPGFIVFGVVSAAAAMTVVPAQRRRLRRPAPQSAVEGVTR